MMHKIDTMIKEIITISPTLAFATSPVTQIEKADVKAVAIPGP